MAGHPLLATILPWFDYKYLQKLQCPHLDIPSRCILYSLGLWRRRLFPPLWLIPTYVAQPHEPCVTFHQQMYGFPLMGDVPLTQDRAAVCSLWHLSVTQVMQHMQTPGKHLHRCLQNTLAGTCLLRRWCRRLGHLAMQVNRLPGGHLGLTQSGAVQTQVHLDRGVAVQLKSLPGSPSPAWRSLVHARHR